MLKVVLWGTPSSLNPGEFGIAGDDTESPKFPKFRKLRGPWQGRPHSGKEINTCRIQGPSIPSLSASVGESKGREESFPPQATQPECPRGALLPLHPTHT